MFCQFRNVALQRRIALGVRQGDFKSEAVKMIVEDRKKPIKTAR
jgi:hypothetical protein